MNKLLQYLSTASRALKGLSLLQILQNHKLHWHQWNSQNFLKNQIHDLLDSSKLYGHFLDLCAVPLKHMKFLQGVELDFSFNCAFLCANLKCPL